jgi:drug/metabolite transporter (DMT)-like permease
MTEGDAESRASDSPNEGAASALPLVWCLLAAALFGASTPASKVLLRSLSPLVLSGLLYLGGALAVLPWALRKRTGIGVVDRRNWLYLLGAVVFGGMIGPVLLLMGLSIASAGSVALWLNLETVATALLARAFFREHLHAQTWIAVVLIVIASASLTGATPGGDAAIVLVALACIAWGLDNNFTATIDRFSPAQITFAKGLAAGLVNTTAGMALVPAAIDVRDVGLSLVVGALAYGASILLYIRGAQQLGATRSQLVFSTAPAFGLGLSWAVLGEPITPMHVLAAALMAIAIWLWHRERHGHPHTHEHLVHVHAHRHDDGHHDHHHGHEDLVDLAAWHSHEHTHEPREHLHEHRPDLHHRHRH